MSFWMARLKSSFVGFGGGWQSKPIAQPRPSPSLYAFGKRETLHFVSSAESLDKLASIICATNTAKLQRYTICRNWMMYSIYTQEQLRAGTVCSLSLLDRRRYGSVQYFSRRIDMIIRAQQYLIKFLKSILNKSSQFFFI
jgi:hypothetical protein